eukprot:6207034-Pleurochrysis_carterae.AAC.2
MCLQLVLQEAIWPCTRACHRPAILQDIDTTAVVNGRSAWVDVLQGHSQPPRTGLTNIDDDRSSLRLSDVKIDERTNTKIVAKINQT